VSDASRVSQKRSTTFSCKNKRLDNVAFSLVELLVVLTIILLLAGVVFAAAG
jgi:prepilin-type N-terminal cleavage/methylation domain-containing protein